MKIAIIGRDSYIGTSIRKALSFNHNTDVTEIEARNNEWKKFNFASYDTVIHVAAIVHRKDIRDKNIYKAVNTDLPVNVAQTAYASGVKHFVYLSSMAVYGKEKSLESWEITGDEQLNPKTFYGESKLEAERQLRALHNDCFHIAIIRPPSVYGKGCRGNLFNLYTKLALFSCIIPTTHTNVKQGLLHIDNLCASVNEIVTERRSGVFHLQDSAPLPIEDILCCIREVHNKRILRSHFVGEILSLARWIPQYVKLYGAVTYSEKLVQNNKLSCKMLTTKEGIYKSYEI